MGTYQHSGDGAEEASEEGEEGGGRTTDGQGMPGGIGLGHDFPEQENQNRQDKGIEEEGESSRHAVIERLHEHMVAQDDESDVDEVVGNEQGGGQAFRILQQGVDAPVGG